MLERAGLSAIGERHALILSRYLSSQYISFARAKLKSADRISEISTTNLLTGRFDDERVKAFKLSKSKPTAKFITEVSCESLLKDVVEYENELATDVTAWVGEDKGGKELVQTESPQARHAINVAARLLPDKAPYNKLQIEATINTADIPIAGLYQYRIRLRPNQFSLPEWVSMWNMRDDEVKRWHLSPSDFNGAKTYNLENFLATLKGAMLSTTQPRIGDVYCYIRVDN
jgi:hypothetical protein